MYHKEKGEWVGFGVENKTASILFQIPADFIILNRLLTKWYMPDYLLHHVLLKWIALFGKEMFTWLSGIINKYNILSLYSFDGKETIPGSNLGWVSRIFLP